MAKKFQQQTGLTNMLVWHRPERTLPKVPKNGQRTNVIWFFKDSEVLQFGEYAIGAYGLMFQTDEDLYPAEKVEWWAYMPKKSQVKK